MCFDEKMNLTEMKIRGEEWRFEEGSHYFISGKEAQIKTVESFPSSIVAHLESESATAKLIISSGKRVTIKMHIKSTLPIESIDIVMPFPEDSQMIKTKEMPAGDEVPFIPTILYYEAPLSTWEKAISCLESAQRSSTFQIANSLRPNRD